MRKTVETGKPISRIDGRLKVMGQAKYAAEFNQKQMAYAFPVRSTIGKGTITAFETSAAEKSAGVLVVLTHENAPRLTPLDSQQMKKAGGLLGEMLAVIQENKVYYFGQYIGLVVAETYEQARHAAALVRVIYAKEMPATDLKSELPNGFHPKTMPKGEEAQINEGLTAALIDAAPVKIERTYTTPNQNHHPMETHATVAVWEAADKLTLYDATQGVMNARATVAYFFGLKPEKVQIISPFIGGGFGCKGPQWAHMLLAAMAGQVVKRPVKFALTRQIMQTNVGRRGETIQEITLACNQTGKLSAIRHHNETYTNLSNFFEASGNQTKVIYAAPMREITYQVAKLNIGTPTFMRAPGEAPGTFALESAMDELAFELKIDPIQLRVINHTSENVLEKLPFSEENLLECYRIGAEKIGWERRKTQPRTNRNGKYLVGMGMATATYPAGRSTASARVQIMIDGSVKVQSATHELGTGTYTIIAQTAADALGVPIDRIKVEIGDTNLPPAPVSGGAVTAASVNPAVLSAAETLRKDLMELAISDGKSKLNGRKSEEIEFADAKFYVKGDASKFDSYADIMRRNSKVRLDACATAIPALGGNSSSNTPPCSPAPFEKEENSDTKKYSFHSFGAQFAEVWVDEDFGTIRVKRFVSVQDIGRVMNEKTARSQIIGGVIFGLGQALMEETVYDKRFGNPVVRHLGDYHFPVNLDVPPIDVHFTGKPDFHISPIGARGIGEIGITGVAAAVANAVFNATGVRLRDLPLTPDKLI